MKPTLPYIKEKFAFFNTLIFAGRLPQPELSLCNVTSFVGQYKSKVRTLPDGRRETYAHQLRFSTAFDLEERDLEDTVIHEMIHYFIAYNGLSDRSAHGPLFKAMMLSINEAHGRAITISRRTSGREMEDARTSLKKWHVVAVLRFRGGEIGVKVLPRVIPKIIEYYKSVSRASNISSVSLYLHNDPFFNRFPTSTARRCQTVTESDLNIHLKGAHTLVVEKDKIIQK